MSTIATARTSHVQTNIDLLLGIARRAGWRISTPDSIGNVLFPGIVLQLADEFIPVRLVLNLGPDMRPMLEQLWHDVTRGSTREQFVLMLDFTPEAVRTYRAKFSAIQTMRVTVGSLLDFQLWIQTRLGPLSKVPLSSPVRTLTEHMLSLRPRQEPLKKRKLVDEYKNAGYKKSLKQGGNGVQGAETLFAFTRGDENVENVEKILEYQIQDVDILVTEPGLDNIKTKLELKAEGYFECAGLENKPNKDAEKLGWMHDSGMDVLGTFFIPTGELFLTDYKELQTWVFANLKEFNKRFAREGTAQDEKQKHKSSIWAVPMNRMLSELNGIVRISLRDWMPTLYGEQPPKTTVIEEQFLRFRTLRPQKRPVVDGFSSVAVMSPHY